MTALMSRIDRYPTGIRLLSNTGEHEYSDSPGPQTRVLDTTPGFALDPPDRDLWLGPDPQGRGADLGEATPKALLPTWERLSAGPRAADGLHRHDATASRDHARGKPSAERGETPATNATTNVGPNPAVWQGRSTRMPPPPRIPPMPTSETKAIAIPLTDEEIADLRTDLRVLRWYEAARLFATIDALTRDRDEAVAKLDGRDIDVHELAAQRDEARARIAATPAAPPAAATTEGERVVAASRARMCTCGHRGDCHDTAGECAETGCEGPCDDPGAPDELAADEATAPAGAGGKR